MADDQLKLDVVVDDHGGVSTLEKVDAGVNKVKASADSAKPSLDALGQQFGVNTVSMERFAAENATSEVSLARFAGLAGGVAVAAVTALAIGFRAAADSATQFVEAGERLSAPASRIQQITQAAADNGVSFDEMTGALAKFQERVASGKADQALRDLHVDLAAFKQLNVVDQFLQLGPAIGKLEDPLERVHLRTEALGTDSGKMATLLTQAFADVANSADKMSDHTSESLNQFEKNFSQTWDHIKTKTLNTLGEMAVATIDFVNQAIPDSKSLGALPKVQGREGHQPAPLPNEPAGVDPAGMMKFLEEDFKQRQAITEEGYRQDAVMRSIAEAQAIITKGASVWADVLEHRVARSVDAITSKLTNAITLNTQLMGGAQQERDRLMAKLTATTNPNESEYDQRFSAIDQDTKRKLAAVDQTDRGTAASAENAILEEMNLKVQELQQNWDGVSQKTEAVTQKTLALGTSYAALGGGGGGFQPGGGTALPGGLVAPTAEQLANHRYFGPVTANGQPDLARMGGAAPGPTTINIHANNSYFDSIDELVKKVAEGLDERDKNLGVRASR
jgi:hypothetical protein